MMIWRLICPHCETLNEVFKESCTFDCGKVDFKGVCINCNQEIEGHQEFWRWLGLPEGPPDEIEE
jgi:hypothetical protein